MKRRALITAIGLVLTAGSETVFAGGSCPSCKRPQAAVPAEVSPLQLLLWFLPAGFGWIW